MSPSKSQSFALLGVIMNRMNGPLGHSING
jgi:hypothetical protein